MKLCQTTKAALIFSRVFSAQTRQASCHKNLDYCVIRRKQSHGSTRNFLLTVIEKNEDSNNFAFLFAGINFNCYVQTMTTKLSTQLFFID